MTSYGLPVLYALFIWWFSTGAILFLDGLPRRTFRFSLVGATLVMAVAAYGLVAAGADTSAAGAYTGFSCGLALWGWLELGYYMGAFAGPRREACPEDCRGWPRFVQAVGTTLYHELGALGIAALMAAATWSMPNKIALWTFLILWVMQISAKLNVFLGVQNLAEGFLPEHLAFLRSYMTRKPMNLFFPFSVTASVVVSTLLVAKAGSAGATPFEVAGFTILSTLTVLAVLEHWFLVVPLPVEVLWTWSLGSRKAAPEPADVPPQARSEVVPRQRLSRRFIDQLFAKTSLPHPAAPSIARRQT